MATKTSRADAASSRPSQRLRDLFEMGDLDKAAYVSKRDAIGRF